MDNHKISRRDNWLTEKKTSIDFSLRHQCFELSCARACRSSRPVQLPTSDRRDHESDTQFIISEMNFNIDRFESKKNNNEIGHCRRHKIDGL